ncbi:hypothetical protein [Dendronalium phyllosphericum]|nr:hypothetical protein [Dendronalium phyllosphericum]
MVKLQSYVTDARMVIYTTNTNFDEASLGRGVGCRVSGVGKK